MRFRPHPLFSDGALLARRRPVRVFGEAPAGSTVRVRLISVSGVILGEASAAADGRFLCELPPCETQTGCRLELCCGGASFAARDVAVGELFLAAGQSNIEWPLCQAAGGAEENETCDDPDLRFFDVPKFARACPEADAAREGSAWKRAQGGACAGVSAAAWFMARKARAELGVPVGVVDCYWGGTSITAWLDGESLAAEPAGAPYLSAYAEAAGGVDMDTYLRREAAFRKEMDDWNRAVEELRAQEPSLSFPGIEARVGACPWHPPVGPGSPYRPAGLFHHMLEWILPLSLTAVLWYQGEEDTGRTDRYDALLRLLLRRWRELFRAASLPFVIAQLPGWRGGGEGWPRLRLQQAETVRQDAHAALACLIDLGEPDNLHPTDKRPVGERFFDAALPLLWGRPSHGCPRVLGVRTEGEEAVLRFDRPLSGEPQPFELCGAAGEWHPARACLEGDGIRLRSPEVPSPCAVRYAWRDWVDVTLRDADGWPVEPFGLSLQT